METTTTTGSGGNGSAPRTNPNTWARVPKAVEHPLLAQIGQELQGCHMSETFQSAGHAYTLRTLTPAEERWADGFVGGQNLYQAGRSRRGPYVAAALEAIDQVHVRDLFRLPDTDDPMTRELFASSLDYENEWRRGEVLRFVGTKMQPEVLAELWDCYVTLEKKRSEALTKIGPLSTRTPTGDSSLTSLLGSMF